MDYTENFDVIIIGGGHAATTAAQACSLMGVKTMMITPDIDNIAKLSCNVSMGGIGRSQLLFELEALGIDIPSKAIDQSATSVTVLNKSKGVAMHSHHAVVDKYLYKSTVLSYLQNLPNLTIFQQSVEDVIVKDSKACGVITSLGIHIHSKAVILCGGTFLNGKMHVGMDSFSGGRSGEAASISLAQKLKELNLPMGRMKTGTPPRIDGNTIDFSKLVSKFGEGIEENNIPQFSSLENVQRNKQLPCWITKTNEKTHEILRGGFDRSPFIQDKFEGKGPRYCPSIEDKITRFTDKDSHQIILEPEGVHTNEYYPNGISTSLPYDVQIQAIRSIEGLENAVITRPGYAIEYDYFDPRSFKQTLEFKGIENLFISTPLGTSGYAEAMSLGAIAGINCALKVKGNEQWVPQRSESYLGVLIDDLTTQGITEPYRMFTSRAEYRLYLRQNNADMRLTSKGYELGLIDENRWNKFIQKKDVIENILSQLKTIYITHANSTKEECMELIGAEIKQEHSLYELLKRPHTSYKNIVSFNTIISKEYNFTINALNTQFGEKLASLITEAIETESKYEGYIKNQSLEVQKMLSMANIKLPQPFDYGLISSISKEAQQLLNTHQPDSLGQASRISGINQSIIGIVSIYLKKNHLTQIN